MQVRGSRVIVVQAVQHGRGDDGACSSRIVLLIPIGDLLFNTLMRSSLVVIGDVFPYQAMRLVAIKDEHVVQTFSFQAAHEAFADSIGTGRSFGSFDGLDTGCLEQG